MSSSILNIFARSPLKSMQEHMDKIHMCVQSLSKFFVHAYKEEWALAQDVHLQIIALEEEADELQKEIRLHLPGDLILPVSRGDLLGLLTTQDKVASRAKHLSSLVVSRKMIFPAVIADAFIEFLELCIRSSELACQAVNELDDLVETGFKGPEVVVVEQIILELDNVESMTDKMQVRLRQELFTIEKDLDALEALFLYKSIDWAGGIADRAQRVGHRLESIVSR